MGTCFRDHDRHPESCNRGYNRSTATIFRGKSKLIVIIRHVLISHQMINVVKNDLAAVTNLDVSGPAIGSTIRLYHISACRSCECKVLWKWWRIKQNVGELWMNYITKDGV